MAGSKQDPLLLHPPTPTAPNGGRAGRRRFIAFLAAAAALLASYHVLLAPPPAASRYHALFLTLGSNSTASAHLRALTLRPHVAGSEANAAAAEPFPLVQETYPGDPYAEAAAEVVPTYFAYSGSGSVAAEVVYANYGHNEDYAYLAARGLNVTGMVALMRYGDLHCEDMVRNARAAGAAAAIVYTDAKDFGGSKGGRKKAFPDGRWLPPTGVQVGSVYYGNGDPTTPLWPSCAPGDDCERLTKEELDGSEAMPGIPALPVSARDGETILKAMGGDVAPAKWQGGEGAPVYRLGPGPAVLNFTYIGNDTLATIENVFAVIEGKEEPDRYVIIGNHRDAWTFGAVDPNSGTAAMLEIGSTEWAEENMDLLGSRAIAYLNVDISIFGPGGLMPRATPQLDELIKEASKMVPNPDEPSQTLYDSMMPHHPPITRVAGAGTDFAAFVQHIGVPSLDMSYGLFEEYPVYHSLYDDYVWVERFGDPLFHRHVAVASVWGLIALKLADDEIIPFNYVSYASELEEYAKDAVDNCKECPVSFSPLHKSIRQLENAATKIHQEKKIYASSDQDDWGTKALPGIVSAMDKAKKSNTTESWRFLQHEIYRVARAVSKASAVLDGRLT
ncbi:hypothetical protein PR202_ga09723 [Eleusine coracana subsp. coracana]|uniref:PA domain-containing protein n=1 Tax=Eleusine coracana subsp. coracana TaxID=191504 RepID=A0AAV5C4I4_ELECO|nr:hypothetical protein PR202_ga09723 [Eleusine coracana subsp. coracana]